MGRRSIELLTLLLALPLGFQAPFFLPIESAKTPWILQLFLQIL
jgi:hypothetical protein